MIIPRLPDKIQMLQELKVGNNPIPEIEQELAELKVKSIHMEKVNTALEKENSVLKDDMSKKEKVKIHNNNAVCDCTNTNLY